MSNQGIMFARTLIALASTLLPSQKTIVPFAPFQPQNGSFSRFIDPLPIPEKIVVPYSSTGTDITITMKQFTTKVHRDLPDQIMWGYNGQYPGPMIEVEKDQKVRVHWKNSLPTTHVFPAPNLDLALRLGLCLPSTPDVRTVTHLHGAEVTEDHPLDRVHNNDGWPDSWILPGMEQIAEYPNHQAARTMWYHDHAMGTTGRNIAAGLAGFYTIHDEYERSLNLPSGKYDIPLLFQAPLIDDDAQLMYTSNLGLEQYGNAISVNGKIWPYLEVEPRKYRFRLVNGSNARSYGLKLVDMKNEVGGPEMIQIASDSGFLAKAVKLNNPENFDSPRLELAPGERAEVIIDFSKYAGQEFLLHNNNREDEREISLPEVMVFKVSRTVSEQDLSQTPQHMKPIARIQPSEASVSRRIVFAFTDVPGTDEAVLTLNGKSWNDPLEEKPKLGATEVWELTNTLNDTHPFHMHLVQFQILDRTYYDIDEFLKSGKMVFTSEPIKPSESEMGWKDTVRATGRMMTRIIMRFLPYTGYYAYHCHILEHEDMDMMRPFQVIK